MGWRLGHFTPVLLPYQGGVTVLLPELSMALKMPSTAEVDGTRAAYMYTIPELRAFLDAGGGGVGQGGGSTSPFGAMFGGSSPATSSSSSKGSMCVSSHSTLSSPSPDSASIHAPTALWERGGDRFALLDLERDAIAYVTVRRKDHGHVGITSMECVGASPSHSSWLIVDQSGARQHVEVPAVSPDTGVVTASAVACTFDSSDSDLKIALRADTAMYTTTGSDGATTLPPSEGLHAASASDEVWRLWKRSSQGTPSNVQFTGAPAPTSTVAVVERPSFGSETESGDGVSPESRVELEIVHLSTSDKGKEGEASLRKVPLFRDQKTHGTDELAPFGGKQRKKRKGSGEDTSIAGVARVMGPRLLTAVLQANGLCRLFETDAGSLEQSASTWQRMKGEEEAQQGSWGITRLGPGEGGDSTAAAKGKADAAARAGERDKDGWSIPKTGLDKPKHGKEDDKNEPHVGGNTWAGYWGSIPGLVGGLID